MYSRKLSYSVTHYNSFKKKKKKWQWKQCRQVSLIWLFLSFFYVKFFFVTKDGWYLELVWSFTQTFWQDVCDWPWNIKWINRAKPWQAHNFSLTHIECLLIRFISSCFRPSPFYPCLHLLCSHHQHKRNCTKLFASLFVPTLWLLTVIGFISLITTSPSLSLTQLWLRL